VTTKLSYAVSNDKILPNGWMWSTLDEVADVTAGNPAPQGQEFFEGGTKPFVRVQDMGRLSGAVKLYETHDYINEKAAKTLKLFPQGSVLFTKSGASTLLNQRVILGRDMYVVSHIAAAIPKKSILSEWLYYWLRTIDFAYLAHATTLPSLPLSKAKAIPVPVAPLDQQKRIVAEIEKQFSRLDEAVANLKRVKANLKRYKAAVLKATVEGRLVETEAELTRKKTPSPLAGEGGGEGASYETGAQLLQRILKTRRSQWKGKGKYKEPTAPDTTDLPELPEGWVWAISDAVFDFVTSGSRGWAEHYSGSGAIFIRVGNLDHGTIDLDLSEIQHVMAPANPEADRSRVKPGDLLISITAELGMVAVAPENLGEAYINQHVAIARSTDLIDKNYIGWYFASEHAGKKQLESIRRGATKAGLGLDDIRSVNIALPPLAEQHRIVAEVDRRFSLVREVASQVDANLKRVERLRQSVLGASFSGRLFSSADTNLKVAV
jgi:type I restriction enzyme S subunit